jgi:hypothetical protein
MKPSLAAPTGVAEYAPRPREYCKSGRDPTVGPRPSLLLKGSPLTRAKTTSVRDVVCVWRLLC